MSVDDFSWSSKAAYLDFQFAILKRPLNKKVIADQRHLHYYHLCYTMTTVAVLAMYVDIIRFH